MNLSRTELWRWLRERKIISQHKRVAACCAEFLRMYGDSPDPSDPGKRPELRGQKIIWQYWAQGFDNAPEIVRQCTASVDKYCPDWTIIRLSDANLEDYLAFPDVFIKKRSFYSFAHISDLLRLMLLKAYGGLWMDSTIMLSGPIPEEYLSGSFFVFRRDPDEEAYKYWRNTYAYYFGWASGFHVNMLNSFIYAKLGDPRISLMYKLLIRWWEHNDSLPDYFFFQILFDVLPSFGDYPLVSDCLPHYLQQSINDPSFPLMDKDEILKKIHIHKLTYK